MGNNKSKKDALIVLGLGDDASVTEIRAEYLDKTMQPKFKRVLSSEEEHLQEEFLKYYTAYVTLMKLYSQSGADVVADMALYPPDQVFQFHYNQGVYLYIKENYLKAGEKFQEAYNLNPAHPTLLLYLGILLLKRNSYYPAEKYFKDAVKIDKNNDDAWFFLAESYLKAGEHRKALTMYETAKNINPGRTEVAYKIRDIKQLLTEKAKGGKKKSFISRLLKKLAGD
jgi:tetratricopeptide (TPR) repeat protein